MRTILIVTCVINSIGLMIMIIWYGRFMFERGFENGSIITFYWVQTFTDNKKVIDKYRWYALHRPEKSIYTSEYIGNKKFIIKTDAKQVEIPED